MVVDVWVEEMGVQLRFAHNSKVIISSPGKKVPAGTSFAITGNSGRSTGPHIHFEADTRKNRTEYRSNTAASPYIPLIMLTRANIQDNLVIQILQDKVVQIFKEQVSQMLPLIYLQIHVRINQWLFQCQV